MDIAGGEEERVFGQGIVEYVVHGAESGKASDRHPNSENAHMLDAGVSQHALDIALLDDKDGCKSEGGDSQTKKGLPG